MLGEIPGVQPGLSEVTELDVSIVDTAQESQDVHAALKFFLDGLASKGGPIGQQVNELADIQKISNLNSVDRILTFLNVIRGSFADGGNNSQQSGALKDLLIKIEAHLTPQNMFDPRLPALLPEQAEAQLQPYKTRIAEILAKLGN